MEVKENRKRRRGGKGEEGEEENKDGVRKTKEGEPNRRGERRAEKGK